MLGIVKTMDYGTAPKSPELPAAALPAAALPVAEVPAAALPAAALSWRAIAIVAAVLFVAAAAASITLGVIVARTPQSSATGTSAPAFVSLFTALNTSRSSRLKTIPAISWFAGQTGFQAMLLATGTTPRLNFTSFDYGGDLGEYITSIDGIGNGGYWIFEVNGKESELGISATRLAAADTLAWYFYAE